MIYIYIYINLSIANYITVRTKLLSPTGSRTPRLLGPTGARRLQAPKILQIRSYPA